MRKKGENSVAPLERGDESNPLRAVRVGGYQRHSQPRLLLLEEHGCFAETREGSPWTAWGERIHVGNS